MAMYRVEDWDVTEGARQNIAHAVPVADLIEHTVDDDGGCVCGPQVHPVQTAWGGYGWMFIHHSLDGRELQEQENADGP
jgi:hypothetical protein